LPGTTHDGMMEPEHSRHGRRGRSAGSAV